MKAAVARARVSTTGLVTAAVVLAPYLTVFLSFRESLLAQAALMLGATVALLVPAARARWRGAAPPLALALGVALYALAAVQGTVVALLRGNQPTLVAGQLLEMGLLPLAAAAAFGFRPELEWQGVAAGVVGGTALGAAIQLGVTGPASLLQAAGPRMMLPNAVSVAGIAPLALLLALALRPSRERARVLQWGATALIVVLILGSRIRSQWLVIPLGLAVYTALVCGRARLLSRRALTGATCSFVVVAGVVVIAAWWWNYPRPNLVSGRLTSAAEASHGTVTAALSGPSGAAIRARGCLTCRGRGNVWIHLSDADPSARPRFWSRLSINVAGTAPAKFLLVLPRTAVGRRLSLTLEDPEGLDCRTTALVVDEIRPEFAAVVVGRGMDLLRRPPDPGAGSTPGPFASDASIGFRIREMSAVLSAIRADPWATWIFGHGLGATFTLDTRGPWLGYDNRGHIVPFNHPNYIHNFFLFLPFKLGVVGTFEVLAALLLFVSATVRGATARPLGSRDRAFLAAAAAAWITYIAWSLAAPQILDFRLAPFWGVVLALTAAVLRSRGRTRQTNGPPTPYVRVP